MEKPPPGSQRTHVHFFFSPSHVSGYASLAGVSRSTTILVAYLMTVTDLSWEECLAATRAVRSYVSPNFGFQQQLQEYERTLLKEVRPSPLIPAGFALSWVVLKGSHFLGDTMGP